MDQSSSSSASSFALQLSTALALPAALKCAVELDLLDLIKKAGRPVSAAELAAKITASNPQAHLMIDRILHLLAANNILRCTGGGSHERLYSVAPVCDFLTVDDDDGVSFAPLFLLNNDHIFMQIWYHLKDAVLEGGVPFERAYGMGVYEYAAKDERVNKFFNRAMSEHSTIVMREILRLYKGFEGVKRLVDVGGGTGASVKMIMSEYPSIEAVNFDLPHVVQVATPQKGVEHVSGDMFASVPRGDAILLKGCKWIKYYLTMNRSSSSSASTFALHLVTACALPAALKCAVELDLLELIKKAGSVSAVELAAKITASNPQAHLMIDRILHLLAANNILRCTGGGARERLYSLAPVCDYLTENSDGVSFAPLFLLHLDHIFMQSWYHLKDAVVEGGVPFKRAHGIGEFEYTAKDARVNKMFNRAMSEHSTIVMREILKEYKGFEGVKRLVDVGGGTGASVKMIVSEYPSIEAVNFDLPHVVQVAAPQKGVEHVSGDMFASVPRGDAILLKSICHDWGDEECLRLLKNCHEALPENGKLIMIERIISEITEKDPTASVNLAFDVIMLANFGTGTGRERTEIEFRALAKASAFKEFKKVGCVMGFWILELYKKEDRNMSNLEKERKSLFSFNGYSKTSIRSYYRD